MFDITIFLVAMFSIASIANTIKLFKDKPSYEGGRIIDKNCKIRRSNNNG